jgi:glycosyltransferase involved in cell wall biosynthesis
LKISESFIRLLPSNPDIKIDFYGILNETGFLEKDCIDIIKNSGNYFGSQPQETIPDILNQYKYFVLPHGRMPEIFNITLLQAINCGTIPLLMNDRNSDFDYTWADWANEFVIPFNKENYMLSAMRQLQEENHDYTYLSKDISSNIQDKFSYWKFKNAFHNLVKGYINE